MTTPKPWLALLLNFVLPGAGLLYLRKWKQAIVNFAIVVVVPLVLFFGVADSTLVEHIHYVFLALAAASAGYAHGVAQSCVQHTSRVSERPKADGATRPQAAGPTPPPSDGH